MAQGRGRAKPQTGPRAAKAKAAEPSARDEAMDTAIVIDGTPYKLGDLELGELEDLEDHTGLPMDAISYGSAKVIAFVVYLVRRRSDPNYSLDDARRIQIRKVKSEKPGIEAEIGGTDGDPTPASSG